MIGRLKRAGFRNEVADECTVDDRIHLQSRWFLPSRLQVDSIVDGTFVRHLVSKSSSLQSTNHSTMSGACERGAITSCDSARRTHSPDLDQTPRPRVTVSLAYFPEENIMSKPEI